MFLQALYILEFLELNNLLGVSHFTFYNHTIGPKANCILQHYIDGKIPQFFATVNSTLRPTDGDKNMTNDGASRNDNLTLNRDQKISVEILPWNLKMKSQKEIRTEGLFASLNDCLYRSMYRSLLLIANY
jgi:Glycosyltransferase family 92